MEAVGDFDEDDADVVAHRQQQLLERLGLDGGLLAEDAARDFGEPVDDFGYLGAEDVAQVLGGVVGVFDDVVEERGADAGAAQPDFLAGNLGHGDGVHDVGLAREAAHAAMSLAGKVEGLVDDFDVLAVVRIEVGLDEVVIGLVDHFIVFYLSVGHAAILL